MSATGAGARLELEQGMAAALELLARARGALARGDLPDLGRLIALPAARSPRTKASAARKRR